MASSATSTSSQESESNEIYQIKVSMRKKQPVWRRLKIPISSKLTFRKLHQILNRAMGWESWEYDYHMWKFDIGGITIGDNMQWMSDFGTVKDGNTLVKSVLKNAGTTFRYVYDFGCDWDHTVILEDIIEGSLEHPVCITGRQACPPEDCNGPDVPFVKEVINDDLKKIL